MPLEMKSMEFAQKVVKMDKDQIETAAEMGWPLEDDGKEFHCPGRESMEIFAVFRLKKIQELTEMIFKKMIWQFGTKEILSTMIVAVAVVMMNEQIMKAVQIFTQIAMVIIMWQMLKILVQMLAADQGMMACMARLEFNETCLGGMEIQRLLQICDKLTIIERRLMAMMGDMEDWLRIFRAEVLNEEWLSMGRCARGGLRGDGVASGFLQN